MLIWRDVLLSIHAFLFYILFFSLWKCKNLPWYSHEYLVSSVLVVYLCSQILVCKKHLYPIFFVLVCIVYQQGQLHPLLLIRPLWVWLRQNQVSRARLLLQTNENMKDLWMVGSLSQLRALQRRKHIHTANKIQRITWTVIFVVHGMELKSSLSLHIHHQSQVFPVK